MHQKPSSIAAYYSLLFSISSAERILCLPFLWATKNISRYGNTTLAFPFSFIHQDTRDDELQSLVVHTL